MEWTPKPCEWLAKLQEIPQTKLLLFLSYSKMQWNSEEHVKRTIRISWTFDMSQIPLEAALRLDSFVSGKGTEEPRSGGGSKHAKRRIWKSEEATHNQKCRRPNTTDMMIRPKLPRFAFDRPQRIRPKCYKQLRESHLSSGQTPVLAQFLKVILGLHFQSLMWLTVSWFTSGVT